MLKEYRMALHQIPEIGFHEFKTKKYLYEQVKNSEAVIHEIGETGLLLYFDNQQEETIAFEQISMHCQSKKKRISLLLLSMKVICMHVVMTDIWRCF